MSDAMCKMHFREVLNSMIHDKGYAEYFPTYTIAWEMYVFYNLENRCKWKLVEIGGNEKW